ncbi:MAG: hypothetical protein LC623_03285 [Halobacteriales archaeon]|nr:hypothetical protein [Halobacteriales archaeon]
MRVRGHTVHILGNLLLALGVVLVVAGIVAAAIAMLWVKDATSSSQRPHEDVGDIVQGLLLGGGVAAAIGLLALTVGIVLRGVGKALRERAQRIDGTAS